MHQNPSSNWLLRLKLKRSLTGSAWIAMQESYLLLHGGSSVLMQFDSAAACLSAWFADTWQDGYQLQQPCLCPECTIFFHMFLITCGSKSVAYILHA